MARPVKEGIDYFSLDVDMDTADDRIFLMEADYGAEGFGIFIKLLMTIYQQKGYYILWDDLQVKRFSKKKSIDIETCKKVVDSLIELDFFSKKLFKKYGILTSCGIQKRYLRAAETRTKVPFIKEFLLLDLASEVSDRINLIYIGINSVNSGINPVKYLENTHKKEKKGKKERKERKETAFPPPASPPEVNSTPKKPPPTGKPPPSDVDKSKSREQQLSELASSLKVEDTVEYKKFLEKHPELEDQEFPAFKPP